LAARPLPDGLTIPFMPAPSALLTRAEQLKGSLLTDEQALGIRDVAAAVVGASGSTDY
jgi:hypothetical protein